MQNTHFNPCTIPVRLTLCALSLALSACTLGPNFVSPTPTTPDDWSSWRSIRNDLRLVSGADQHLRAQWWEAFGDPVLDRLQARAIDASPDLRTAVLRFAQARVQRNTVTAQQGPEVGLSGGVSRQKQSEYGASTRMIDAIGGNRDKLAGVLSEPFTLYQTGFDVSWEPDLWGRVSRSIEAANADVASQAALLDISRLGLASDLARNYFELRTTQRQIKLAQEDIAALSERLDLLEARTRSGVADHFDLERQRADLAAIKAQLPSLQAQEGVSINQIALLLGVQPESLTDDLKAVVTDDKAALPDLSLGLPSEVALRRPDVRAAEARLHRATATIGIAQADLYPSIRLGGRLGLESYRAGEFADWGSRSWSIGPSLNLPIFDRGRRKSVVQLRELEQQEAAVNYQKTVLKAWQEIDDALSAYVAKQQQLREQENRVKSASNAYQLALARHAAGITDYLIVLDSQRSYLQARREWASCRGELNVRFVMINKAIGNISVSTHS